MSVSYDVFFDRVPDTLLRWISNACSIGDEAFEQIVKSEPRLFQSSYIGGLRSRLHDKVVQLYLEERLKNDSSMSVLSKHTGFGNYVMVACGNNFGLTACHIPEIGTLPRPAKYKLKACASNPGNSCGQLNLFTPPVAREYLGIHFILTLFFDGMRTVPALVLPDNSFSAILSSKPIMSVMPTQEEAAHHDRIMPKILFEVKKEHEQQQNNA